jgi:tetratricopeptide (TPR) repeat protein
MAVDKNKIVAEATKLVQKGAFDKAIKQYERILAEDPKDVRVLLKVGELHQKKGDDHAAAGAFQKVAETYADQGFFLKSVAVYKQIVKLDPEDVRVNERLAALYQQLGLMSDAMGQLQSMAAAYEKQGDAAKLTDALKRMVDLDPDNIASSIKLGELQARAGQPGPALEHFRRAAAYLKRHNRADEYLKVAERIALLQPGDLPLTRELAHIYLAKGDTKRALAKLQQSFKADPKELETLQLLAQAFRDLGQTAKTLSVYKELAHVQAEQGRHGEARGTWRKVQELAPDDEDAAAALGAQHARGGPPAATPPPPPPPAPLGAAAPAGAPGRAPPRGPPPGAARPSAIVPPPPAPAPSADAIPKLLTETDVYVKYGLHDKALDHLRKILALDPQSPDAHEKCRELHAAAGRAAEAGEAGAMAVRALLARGQGDRAREALARLRQISPAHPALSELAAAAGATEEVALEAAEVEDFEPVEEELVVEPGSSADDDALALAAAGHAGDEVVDDDDEPLSEEAAAIEIVPEPEPEPEPAPAPARRPPAAPASAAPPRAPAAPAATPRPPAPRAPPAAPVRGAAPAPPPREDERDDEEVDLSDELEEADFFVQQGLLEEAREALSNLLAFYPGHRAVKERLAALERRAAPAPAPRPAARGASGAAGAVGAPRPTPSLLGAAGATGPDDSFDIARELAEELGDAPPSIAADDGFQYSVEDVFNQFKKGVEQTVRPEDSATHYDLGIAYKEMGLLEDAIGEFETALRGNDRKREVDCLTMIGVCRMAKGEPVEAVAAFRRALACDPLSKDAAKALQYELGAAYEAAGDREVALHCFQRAARLDPGFRDAAARAAALGGGPGKPPPDDGRAPPRPPGRAGAGSAAGAPPVPGAKKNIGYL